VTGPLAPTPERRRPSLLRWLLSGLGLASAALFVALLGYGVMAQSPNTSIAAALAGRVGTAHSGGA
jgi:hypothetical protein